MPARRRRSAIQAFSASPARNLVGGVLFMLVVMALATLAYIAAGWDFSDALYMVVITVFTVGYDEVRPVADPALRAITIALIVFGCTGMIFLTGALVQFITFAQIQLLLGSRRMKTEIDALSGHVIVCGYGRIGQMLADELKAGNAAFVILETNEQRFAESTARGYLTWKGDATDEGVLEAAGIMRARALATVVPNDAANVFITLSARNLNRDLEIIARGEAPSTKSKLLQAGANAVVEPTHIGAERIAQLILFPRSSSFTDGSGRMSLVAGLRTLGLEIEVVAVAANSPLAGATVAQIEQEAIGGVFVVGIDRRNGETLTRPDPATVVQAGDGVVVVTRSGRATPRIG